MQEVAPGNGSGSCPPGRASRLWDPPLQGVPALPGAVRAGRCDPLRLRAFLWSVRAGARAHEGGDYWAPTPASGPARYALVPWAGASAPEAVLLIAVKASATALHTNASLPPAFAAGP